MMMMIVIVVFIPKCSFGFEITFRRRTRRRPFWSEKEEEKGLALKMLLYMSTAVRARTSGTSE